MIRSRVSGSSRARGGAVRGEGGGLYAGLTAGSAADDVAATPPPALDYQPSAAVTGRVFARVENERATRRDENSNMADPVAALARARRKSN